MKSRKLRKIFVSIFSSVAVLTGALGSLNVAGANLSFAAENPETHVLKGVESAPASGKEEDAIMIRIGTWYTEDNLTNLKEYLAKEFPNYNFEFEYTL